MQKKTNFMMIYIVHGVNHLLLSPQLSSFFLINTENPIQAYLSLLHFTLLQFTDVAFYFLQIEARHSTSKKMMTRFIAMVWKQTLNISEVCLSTQGPGLIPLSALPDSPFSGLQGPQHLSLHRKPRSFSLLHGVSELMNGSLAPISKAPGGPFIPLFQ